MTDVDPRLRSALRRQLVARDRALEGGASRIGWKLGMGDAERIGNEMAAGFLTSATLLTAGSSWGIGEFVALHADAELAVELGDDVAAAESDDAARGAILGYGAALEIVDLGQGEDAETVVAGNVFHRAVAFGPFVSELPPGELTGALDVNGETQARATVEVDIGARLRPAARVLEAVGERLRRGDRVILGSVVQVPVQPGDEAAADFGTLGRVRASIVAG